MFQIIASVTACCGRVGWAAILSVHGVVCDYYNFTVWAVEEYSDELDKTYLAQFKKYDVKEMKSDLKQIRATLATVKHS